MSEQLPVDPRLEQSSATDDSLLAAHEKEVGKKPNDGGHYRMLPLVLLFVFSGLIFYGGTYLNFYSGHYHSDIFNENAVPSNAKGAVAKVDPLVLGKKNYEAVCATCHQLTGLGVEGIYPPLAGSEWVQGTPDRVIRIVLHGLKGPVTVKGKQYSAAAMPAFGKVAGSGYNWNDDRIAAVLTYIRHEWGNNAEPITAEQVAAIHTQEGNRKEWSEEELKKLP
jgi:mono/diheme cytochrome c family protein